MIEALGSLVAALVVVAFAPVLVTVVPGRIPQVVALILGGVLIGPQALNVASPSHTELFANLGLGFLFLLAGFELDPRLVRGREGRLALGAWVASVVLAIVVVELLELAGFVTAFVAVSIGLTTTALGTLLPILREHEMDSGPLGRYMFAAGAIGEIGPVLAMALLLGRYGAAVEVLGIAFVGGAAFALSAMARSTRGSPLGRVIARTSSDTSQSRLRLTTLLLTFLLFLSAEFGIDVVLGAFFAGMAVRRAQLHDVAAFEHKLDTIGYGFFIPVFFVTSGMALDVRSILDAPLRLLVFFLLLLTVRGLPTFVLYRHVLSPTRRLQLALLSATALPLLVALAEIGLDRGMMLRDNAAALVGAGILSVAIFPLVATRLEHRARDRE
jgi:Kef-type K+ transport system membrane component KefB